MASLADLFADYVDGENLGAGCIALALSAHPLGAEARNAVEKSLASFGYGERSCTYATLAPKDAEAGEGGVLLDPNTLFLLVEGLDPLLMVCADATAAQTVAQAYRTPLEPDCAARALGKPLVAFDDLEGLLETPDGKQRAWALLKTLPRR